MGAEPRTGKVYAAAGGSYSDYRIYAIFATKALAQAFVNRGDSYADSIEEYEVRSTMPVRIRWYVVERYPCQDEVHRHFDDWDFEGPPFQGYRRAAASFHRWPYTGGTAERCFGQSKAAVEKMWKEVHAAVEARDAGL